MVSTVKANHSPHVVRKFGPWKDCLLETWKQKKAERGQTGNGRVEFLKSVVQALCTSMSKKHCPKYWVQHCNRFRGREMGPYIHLKHLGFSRKGQASPGADVKVERFIATWDAIENAIGTQAPKNVSEWACKMSAAKAAANALPPAPRLQGKYLLPWSIRALLRDRMQQQGIKQLKIDAAATLNSYIYMCPDSSGGLAKARQYFIQVSGKSNMGVKEFIQECGGKAPELLSMWLLSCMTLHA